MTGVVAWSGLPSPDLAMFERLAADAFAALPATFRAACEGLAIRVADFADDETLDELGVETPFDLLGLFQGVGLAQGGGPEGGRLPNTVWLYRRPILDVWADGSDTLDELVTHVLVHEIGHHLGLSDDDMERIEGEG